MAIPTHLITEMDSEQGMESYVGPDVTLYEFETPLEALDGRNFFARSISRLPRPGWPDEFAPGETATGKFLQVGGSAERMTAEIRKDIGGGDQRLFKIGHHPAADSATPPDTVIQVGANANYVYENEVFNAEESAKLFMHYYLTDDLPEGYVLRDMNF